MESLLNLPLWINKSGLITKDIFFSDPTITPHAGVEIVFLVSDAATHIRMEGSDGKAYAFYLPDGIAQPIATTKGEMPKVRILSDAIDVGTGPGNDWQGLPLPIPNVPGANIKWYGH